jgi:DtxR family Mn-dependent transcriptional regulator
VIRIPEELEFAPGVLDYLEETRLMPGATGTVTDADTDGAVTVSVDGRDVDVDSFTGSRILVTV